VVFTCSRRRFGLLAGAIGLVATIPNARAEKGIRPHWSFHAGAPLSGPPGVGADGTLVFGTVDGYVHAVRADGVFRYSYTVAGRVVSNPVVFDDGLVLVATDKSRLYAIQPDGSLAWWKAVAGGVASDLALDTRGRVWLRTGSGTAIAVSRRGGVVGFAKIGRAMTLGPVPLASGPVLVASPAGELGVIGDFGKYRRSSLAAPLTGLRALGPGFIALREGSLTWIDSDLGSKWVRDDIDRLLCTDPLVTFEKGVLRWLTSDGAVAASAAIEAALGEPSTCTSTSVFAVNDRNELVQVRRGGGRGHVDAPAGTLLALDASRPGSLVAAYRDGRVVSLKVVP
jgi:outer membrane protein assembly factor BamB